MGSYLWSWHLAQLRVRASRLFATTSIVRCRTPWRMSGVLSSFSSVSSAAARRKVVAGAANGRPRVSGGGGLKSVLLQFGENESVNARARRGRVLHGGNRHGDQPLEGPVRPGGFRFGAGRGIIGQQGIRRGEHSGLEGGQERPGEPACELGLHPRKGGLRVG